MELQCERALASRPNSVKNGIIFQPKILVKMNFALLVSCRVGECDSRKEIPPFIPLWQRGKEGNLSTGEK